MNHDFKIRGTDKAINNQPIAKNALLEVLRIHNENIVLVKIPRKIKKFISVVRTYTYMFVLLYTVPCNENKSHCNVIDNGVKNISQFAK